MFDMRRRSLATAGARAWLVLVVLLMSGAAAQAAAAQTMAVPAYLYPGSYWTQLDQAGPGVGIAVMNPTAARAPARIQTTSVRCSQRRLPASPWWATSTRATGAAPSPRWSPTSTTTNGLTVLNPGTKTNQCYEPAADIPLTFEGSDKQYVNSYSAPSLVTHYPASHFWHVIYRTPTVSAMATAVQLSKARNGGYVHVTSASLPNPYDVLPSGLYWSSELADIGATGGGGRHG